mgnify:CR=1 FL=1
MQFVIKPKVPITLYGRNYPIRGNCVMELTSGEVFLCLSKGAQVTLIKPNNTRVALNMKNYKTEIANYNKVKTEPSKGMAKPTVSKHITTPNLELNSQENVITKEVKDEEKETIDQQIKDIKESTDEVVSIIDNKPTKSEDEDTEVGTAPELPAVNLSNVNPVVEIPTATENDVTVVNLSDVNPLKELTDDILGGALNNLTNAMLDQISSTVKETTEEVSQPKKKRRKKK